MREAALGHWTYFTWHLPATVLTAAAILLAGCALRSILRDARDHAGRALRWRIVGFSVLFAAASSAVVWPYLGAAASITVEADGTWRVANYLGVPLAWVAPTELRELRGVDLGGLGWGTGHLEIRRGDGSVLRSVRVTRATLEAAWRALGYRGHRVQRAGGDVVIAAHRYAAAAERW